MSLRDDLRSGVTSEGDEVSDNVTDPIKNPPEETKDLGVCPFLTAGAIAAGGLQNGKEMPAVRCIGAACHLWFETKVVDPDGNTVEEIRRCQLWMGAEWSRRSFVIQGQILATAQQRVMPVGPILAPRQDGR